MKRPILDLWMLAAQLAAFWPVLGWWWARVASRADARFGLVALAVGVAVLARQRAAAESPARGAPRLRAGALLLVVYAGLFARTPELLRAAGALAILAVTFRASLAVASLFLISLPCVPALNFHFGYPLRAAVGEAVAAVLRLGGFGVERQGTLLTWQDQVVVIDAPCSGVRMLWTGLVLGLGLAAFRRLRRGQVIMVGLLCVALVLLANTVRALALFFPETGLVAMPGWGHDAVGLLAFAFMALLAINVISRMEARPCVTGRSSSSPA